MRILFLDGTAGFSPDMMATAPVGGICTSLNILPRGLASLGYEVFVYNIETEQAIERDGVKWIHRDYGRVSPDVVVYNRNFIMNEWIDQWPNAKHILWLHDIPNFGYMKDDAITRVDKIVALSEYQKLSYKSFYGIPDDKFVVIRNGYDPEVFFRGKYDERDPHLYLHASAPVKGGLDSLIVVFKGMQKVDPQFKLLSFCNQSLHKLDNAQFESKLEDLKTQGVIVCDPIPQRELAMLMRKAWVLLMPNSYPENCSNTMIQAQASGLPVVASAVGDCADKHVSEGILKTETQPSDIFWHFKDFADRAIHLAQNAKLHHYMSERGPRSVETWTQILNKWSNLIGTECTSSAKTVVDPDGGKKLTPEELAADAGAIYCEHGGL